MSHSLSCLIASVAIVLLVTLVRSHGTMNPDDRVQYWMWGYLYDESRSRWWRGGVSVVYVSVIWGVLIGLIVLLRMI